MKNDDGRRGTADEIKFIKGLGSWGVRERNRMQLLRKYIRAARNRANWGTIQKNEAIAFAKSLLAGR